MGSYSTIIDSLEVPSWSQCTWKPCSFFSSKHLLESSSTTPVVTLGFPSSSRAWSLELFLTNIKPNLASDPDLFCFVLRLQYICWWWIYATYSQAVCNPDCSIPQILSLIRTVKLRYLASRSASLFHYEQYLLWQFFSQAYYYTPALLKYWTVLYGKHCLDNL